MIYTDEEIAAGLQRLGTRDEAQKFLRQHLMREVVTVTGPATSDGAARYCEGRRSFALDLMRDLGLSHRDDGDGGRTDGGIASGRREQPVGNSRGGAGRRVPPARDE